MRNTVRNRLTWFMLLTLIPMCLVIILQTKDRYESRKLLILNKQQQIASAVAAFVEAWLDDAMVLGTSLSIWPNRLDLNSELFSQYLDMTSKAIPKFDMVFAVDDSGSVFGNLGTLNRSKCMPVIRKTAADCIRKNSSIVFNLYKKGKQPLTFIFYPLKENNDEVNGALIVELSMSSLLNKINRLRSGLTGEFVLTDPQKRVILSTGSHKQLGELLRKNNGNIIARVTIPGYNWAAYASVSLKEVMIPVYRSAARDIGILIIAVTLTVIIARHLSKRFIEPIKALEKMVIQVSKGQHSREVLREGDFDEFTNLSLVFQEMSEQLTLLLNSYKAKTQEAIQLYEELRKAYSRLASAQEDERQRLSRELHDWINQYLVTTFYTIQTLALSEDPISDEDFTKLSELLNQGNTELRRVMKDLHPHLLEDLGLSAACKSHIADYQARTGIECTLNIEVDENKLNKDMKLTIFRIIQEALMNTAKHAKTNKANVVIVDKNGAIHVEIIDHGSGFIENENLSSGVGLVTMKERASIVGGTFDVVSVIGQGTTIIVKIPLH